MEVKNVILNKENGYYKLVFNTISMRVSCFILKQDNYLDIFATIIIWHEKDDGIRFCYYKIQNNSTDLSNDESIKDLAQNINDYITSNWKNTVDIHKLMNVLNPFNFNKTQEDFYGDYGIFNIWNSSSVDNVEGLYFTINKELESDDGRLSVTASSFSKDIIFGNEILSKQEIMERFVPCFKALQTEAYNKGYNDAKEEINLALNRRKYD